MTIQDFCFTAKRFTLTPKGKAIYTVAAQGVNNSWPRPFDASRIDTVVIRNVKSRMGRWGCYGDSFNPTKICQLSAPAYPTA